MLRGWRPRRWNPLIRCKSLLWRPVRSLSNKTLPSKRDESLSSRVLPYGLLLWGVLFGGHVFFTYGYTVSSAYGISMLPTFSSFGDQVLISKRYRRGRNVRVGDVVSFKHPVHEGEAAIKRVVGLEGDFVLMNTPEKSDAMMQVPQGHCWVVGDNLQHSRDSRMFGPLPLALIQGKVLARLNFEPKFRGVAWIQHGLVPYVDDDSDED